MTEIVWIVSVLTAYFLGYCVGEYGPPLFRLLDGVKLPQLRWPWHYSEADAYAKKYCSDELALASEQARESEGRTMGDKTEPRPVGPRNLTWQEAEELKWKGRIADKANDLEQRVTALEEKMPEDMNLHLDQLFNRVQILERKLDAYLETATPSPPTASPTREVPSDAAERDYTPRLSPASWRSGLATTTGGPAEHPSQSAQGTDAST